MDQRQVKDTLEIPDTRPMSQKWYVQKSNESVEGPLTSDQVQERLSAGDFNPKNMVWGHGMEHWRPIDWWMTHHNQLNNVTEINTAKETWHFAHKGQSFGPYGRAELLDHLKSFGMDGEVMLWTKGMKEWAPLFEFHDILEDLGVGRRQHPRAPVDEVATLTSAEKTFSAPLFSISEGGFGIRIQENVEAGQQLTVELSSPAFRQPIHARAEVRYCSSGVAGIRFIQLSSEAKGAIIQYIRQQAKFKLKAA